MADPKQDLGFASVLAISPSALSVLNFRVTPSWIGRFDVPFRGGSP